MSDALLIPGSDGRGYDPIATLAETTDSVNVRCRLRRFVAYQDDEGLHWYEPDLAGWRDSMLDEGLKPRSVSSYICTIRRIYRDLMKDNRTRDFLYGRAPAGSSALVKKAFVDEVLVRLENATDPSVSRVKLHKKQDLELHEHFWLTAEQAQALVEAPDTNTLRGLRNAMMFALLLCTGVRVGELCAIAIEDLRCHLGQELALRVRHGKGDKQRLVVYGAMDWCLEYVDDWLARARISAGTVVRGISEGRIERIQPGRVHASTIRYALDAYPILIDGVRTVIKPHDLRRTYARLQYEAGMDLVALQQNLGHRRHDTTVGYIGDMSAGQRRGRGVFRVTRP